EKTIPATNKQDTTANLAPGLARFLGRPSSMSIRPRNAQIPRPTRIVAASIAYLNSLQKSIIKLKKRRSAERPAKTRRVLAKKLYSVRGWIDEVPFGVRMDWWKTTTIAVPPRMRT